MFYPSCIVYAASKLVFGITKRPVAFFPPHACNFIFLFRVPNLNLSPDARYHDAAQDGMEKEPLAKGSGNSFPKTQPLHFAV